MIAPEWGWGTEDSAQALKLLSRFGSVTVLNGHIHQLMQKVEGAVTFHTARSTAFPQPAPGTAPSPGPKRVPAGELRKWLGVREVAYSPTPTDARRHRFGSFVKAAANRRMVPFSAKQGRWPLSALRAALGVLCVSLFSTQRTPRLHQDHKIRSFGISALKGGKRAKLLIALMLACAFAPPASAGALVGRRRRAASRSIEACTDCHSLDKNDVGPRHRGVFGRKAGSLPDYSYSEALKSSNIVWNEETLDKWLTDPQALRPGREDVLSSGQRRRTAPT